MFFLNMKKYFYPLRYPRQHCRDDHIIIPIGLYLMRIIIKIKSYNSKINNILNNVKIKYEKFNNHYNKIYSS